jgi:hypothetical protein
LDDIKNKVIQLYQTAQENVNQCIMEEDEYQTNFIQSKELEAENKKNKQQLQEVVSQMQSLHQKYAVLQLNYENSVRSNIEIQSFLQKMALEKEVLKEENTTLKIEIDKVVE